jgi:hypothetical protein
MTTESDSDSDAAAAAAHGGSAGGSGSGSETSSSSAPSTPGTPGTPAAAPNPAAAGAAGPRPAPGYTVVNAVIEKKEDGPGCRCGHTLTAVPAVGEEGTPVYIGPRLILFGGATALEGNSATPPSSAGSAGIRMLFYLSHIYGFCFLILGFWNVGRPYLAPRLVLGMLVIHEGLGWAGLG